MVRPPPREAVDADTLLALDPGARGTETAKRVDIYATALFHKMSVDGLNEFDLSYSPPLGSPWDAVQMAAQAWVREHLLSNHQAAVRERQIH